MSVPAGRPHIRAKSPFLRRMRAAIITDLEPTIRLTQQVAVLQAAGHKRTDIANRTGCSPAELRDALARVKRIAPDLELPNPEDL
jgi:hypothetical protein